MLTYEVEPSLILRLLDLPDAEIVFAQIEANRSYLRAWLPWLDLNTKATDSAEFIKRSRNNFAARRSLPLGIFKDGNFVGHIECFDLDWENKSAEIGYWLAEDAAGQGIMTKCCRAVINHFFNEHAFERIVICAHVDNVASRAVAERLGFTFEGISRNAASLYGTRIDHANYALLVDEWVE